MASQFGKEPLQSFFKTYQGMHIVMNCDKPATLHRIRLRLRYDFLVTEQLRNCIIDLFGLDIDASPLH